MITKTNTTASKLTDSLRRAKNTQEKPASQTTAALSRQKSAKPVVKKEESNETVKPMGSKRVWPD